MTATTLFYIIIAILILSFIIDKILDTLNSSHYNDPIPIELKDVYGHKEYQKSQAYKKVNDRFGSITSLVSLVATLAFFFLATSDLFRPRLYRAFFPKLISPFP